VTPFQQNCAILWDEASMRALVVDPGGDVDRILAAIDQTGVTVERILLTHGHLDHAGRRRRSAEALRARPDAGDVPIDGPDRRDAFLLEGISAQAAQYGFEARDVTPDRWFHEGDSVALGPHRFDILHCPGHTPGHVVFVNHAARFALVGECGCSRVRGRTDFPYGDHDALISGDQDEAAAFWGTIFRSCAGTVPVRTLARSGGRTRSCVSRTPVFLHPSRILLFIRSLSPREISREVLASI